MKRIICLLLCVFLLHGGIYAADEADLQTQLDSFMQENNLTDSKFSMSYYNLSTGEAYAFNDAAFLPVGAVWTLPLHMYYYKQETLGAFDPLPEYPEEVYTINGLTLEDCRYHSILRSDNAVSESMREKLGTPEEYQRLINEEFGHLAADSLPEEYLTDLRYSAAFLMNCLKELTVHEEYYGMLTKNYSLAQTGSGLAGYGKGYSLMHILGEEDGSLCDVGIVFAPQTYLLVCFTSANNGRSLLAQLNALLCTYVEEQAGIASTTATTRDTTRSDSDFILSSPEREDHTEVLQWILYALGAAICLAVAAGVVIWLLRRRREKEDWQDS